MATQEAPPAWQAADAPPADIPTQEAPPTGQTATTSTNGEFGSSEYGQRLDFSQPKYQDLWAFIAFYVHIVVIIVLSIVFWLSITNYYAEHYGDYTPSPLSTATTSAPESDDEFDGAGIIVALIAGVFAGVLFGMLWLQCMKMWAEYIIKILLFTAIGCFVVVALLGLLVSFYLTVVFLIIAALFGLYTWCIWGRIPFAAACLSIASKIVQLYGGVVWCAFLAVVCIWIWNIISLFCMIGYYWSSSLTQECTTVYNSETGVYEQQCTGGPNQLVIFLLFVSYYWGINVWSNVSHTTTCGVAAAWYFNPGVLKGPVSAAFRRTMTTSFGSICFGSLLVAIIQAIRAMLNNNKRGGRCAGCLLRCIERLIRYFNKYAYAQVAIYGTSFWVSAKATWSLFLSKGILAIINDNLSSLALVCGAVLGAVSAGVAAWFVGAAFYGAGHGIDILMAIVCAWLGYKVVAIILTTVESGVVCIFVCWAEDPAACHANRPEAYNKLCTTEPRMAQIAANEGVPVNTGQQQPPPQQA